MLSRLFLSHGTDQKSVTNKGHQYDDCVTDDISDSPLSPALFVSVSQESPVKFPWIVHFLLIHFQLCSFFIYGVISKRKACFCLKKWKKY